jgi:hypothetical protein
MSIEKAAEAIKNRAIHAWLMALPDKMCEELTRAALPHLLEEPTPAEILRALGIERNTPSDVGTELALQDFVRRRNAPPEPPEPVETHTVMLEHGLGCSVRDRARTTISHVTSLKLDGVDILRREPSDAV